MTPHDLSKKHVRVTERIDKILWSFPQASPKEIARILTNQLYPSEPLSKHLREVYLKYRNMISVRKSLLKRWRQTKVKGHLPKPLISSHRVEWEIERGVPMDKLIKVRQEAAKRRPRLEDPRPIGEWYVIPNRNQQCEFHDDRITVRVMPKTGTCRILSVKPMDYKDLSDLVWEAFFKAGLRTKECDELVRDLTPHKRHRTFRVGPVTPFKIDYYKDPLGLTILADGSHPQHIETIEGWPSWVKPLLESHSRQLESHGRQTEAITLLTEQIRLHLDVMKGINEAVKDLKVSTDALRVSTDTLRETLVKVKEKPKHLRWLRGVIKRKSGDGKS